MECTNTIEIYGPIERIFELGAAIEDWPRILPHYRYVRIEGRSDGHTIASMGASRDGIPVKWKARQEVLPNERRILFKHIGGVTKGMDVEWRLESVSDCGLRNADLDFAARRGDPQSADAAPLNPRSVVRVSIHHSLDYPVPVLGRFFAEYIVGRLFVSNIAGKTLKRIKEIVESETVLLGAGELRS